MYDSVCGKPCTQRWWVMGVMTFNDTWPCPLGLYEEGHGGRSLCQSMRLPGRGRAACWGRPRVQTDLGSSSRVVGEQRCQQELQLGGAPMSIQRMNTETVIWPQSGILHSREHEQTSALHDVDDSPQRYCTRGTRERKSIHGMIPLIKR